MKQQPKHTFARFQAVLSQATTRENITHGDCDFCYHPAKQGRSFNSDVFLVCTSHEGQLNEHPKLPVTRSVVSQNEIRVEQANTQPTEIRQPNGDRLHTSAHTIKRWTHIPFTKQDEFRAYPSVIA